MRLWRAILAAFALAFVVSASLASGPTDAPGRRVWLPSDIKPSKFAWFRADLAPSPVDQWPDSFGLGHGTATQATGARRPAIVTGAINGRTVLRGTRAAQTGLHFTGTTLTSQTTIFMVVGGADATTDSVILDDTAGAIRLFFNLSGNDKKYQVGVSTFRTIATTAAYATYHVLGISQNDAGNLSLYADGVQTYSAAKDDNWSGHIMSTIGCYHVDTNAFQGDIGEFILLNTALGATDMVNISNRLRQWWGL